jgi:uncharacterized protein YuzE
MATVKTRKKKENISVRSVLKVAAELCHLPWDKVHFHYDREADVMYISIGGEPRPSNDVDEPEDGVLLRYQNGELVGITILDASQR